MKKSSSDESMFYDCLLVHSALLYQQKCLKLLSSFFLPDIRMDVSLLNKDAHQIDFILLWREKSWLSRKFMCQTVLYPKQYRF